MGKRFEMPTAAEWLDMLKEEKGFVEDAECAAFLGVSRQAVSHWRQNRHQMGVGDAVAVGLATGVNPLFVIMSNQYHAARPEKREKWILLATPVEPKTPRKPGRKRLNSKPGD